MKKHLFPAIAFVTLGIAAAASAADDKARDFLKKAMQGDNSEVMLGKLAAEHGGSDAMKRYGQMLMDDHAMHLQKVQKIASAMNVPVEHEPLPAAEKERDKLSKLQGDKFDHELAEYMIKDHREDLKDYRKASDIKGDVGKLARDTVPTLQKHLSEAEKLKG